MRSQYDAIGGHYATWKQTPIPVYLEVPTVRRLLDGLVEGRAILDLACGTGFYSRLLKQLGAARIIGVDISEAMIAEARAAESQEPVGIEYVVADAATLPVLGTFDLATAMYLLHYAETPESMHQMCRKIAANLKPGGRLVALLPEPDYLVGQSDTARYGFAIRSVASDEDWFLVHADIHTTPPFSLEYRHWARHVYREALEAGGSMISNGTPSKSPPTASAGMDRGTGGHSWRIRSAPPSRPACRRRPKPSPSGSSLTQVLQSNLSAYDVRVCA